MEKNLIKRQAMLEAYEWLTDKASYYRKKQTDAHTKCILRNAFDAKGIAFANESTEYRIKAEAIEELLAVVAEKVNQYT